MCGIAGVYNFRSQAPVEAFQIRQMINLIEHRGPDDEGIVVDGSVGLGHRRLSIIDLSTGRQPIGNEDRTVWIVFNGEIYNHHELRSNLELKNHAFTTKTDTEVIVHLYEEHGTECVRYLRGMFAFAIWDSKLRRLLLARDRFGKKPLYYSETSYGDLVFGSEIKSLLLTEGIKREINCQAMDDYLHLLYVPGPQTMFSGIHKLPAGHTLVCTPSTFEIKQYWDLSYEPAERQRSITDYCEEFKALFDEAVEVRLESDVPLGAFLSGGLDSSAVVEVMTRKSKARVVCAAVGFDDEYTNELPYAREVAEHLNAEYHEYTVSAGVRDLLSKLTWHFDEPFGDSSAIPTYWVCAVARRSVTVALSGDGGDEVLGGYSRHMQTLNSESLNRLPGSIRKFLSLALNASWPSSVPGRRFAINALASPKEAAVARHYDYILTKDIRASIYSREVLEALDGYDGREIFREYYQKCGALDVLDKALYLDLKTYLVDDILIKVDRMSMAHGLEVRCPFLDHRLVEFVANAPRFIKINGRERKYLLRLAEKDRLPEHVFKRPKHGFSPPIKKWLMNELKEMVEDVLFDKTATDRRYFQQKEVERQWGMFLNGGGISQHFFFAMLMFELWHRQFLDSQPSSFKSTATT
ncbi:asparagine synthase (glutamine-hydrolyzing) [Candidatus Nitrospira bockiana]